MAKEYTATDRINTLYQLLIDDCDTITAQALEKILNHHVSLLDQLSKHEKAQKYINTKNQLINYIQENLITQPIDVTDAQISKKYAELAKQLHLSTTIKILPAQLESLTQQLQTVQARLINYKWLQAQGFIEPDKLILTTNKTFSARAITDLLSDTQHLLREYQACFDKLLQMPIKHLQASDISEIAKLRELQHQLIVQTKNTLEIQQHNNELYKTIKKALKSYKAEHGLVKFLALVNSSEANLFDAIKIYISPRLYSEIQAIINNQQVSHSILQSVLVSFTKVRHLRQAIQLPQSKLDQIDKESNQYFSKDFSEDDPEQAAIDFRRNNFIGKNGFNINPTETDQSIKSKIFQFAKNPILAKHLLARGGQAQQESLLTSIVKNIDFVYQNSKGKAEKCHFSGHSNASTTQFANTIKSDTEGDYLLMDVDFKLYAIFPEGGAEYMAVDKNDPTKLVIISPEEKLNEIDNFVTQKATPARAPVIKISMQKKLYIEAYAFKQGEQYYAMSKISHKLTSISEKEFNNIKAMLLKGNTPKRSVIPLKMLPPEIAHATAIEQADNLLGKIRIKHLKMSVDECHGQLIIMPGTDITKKPYKTAKFVPTDAVYYQRLHNKLQVLKAKEQKLEQAPDSADQAHDLNKIKLEIIDINLEQIKHQRHQYKMFFQTAHKEQKNIDISNNIIELATHQLTEYELKQQQLALQLTVHKTELLAVRDKKMKLLGQHFHQAENLLKQNVIPNFVACLALLENPIAHIRKRGKTSVLSVQAQKLEDNIKKQVFYNNKRPKYNPTALDKNMLEAFIDDLTQCIKVLDDYLAKTKRSMLAEVIHSTKKFTRYSSDSNDISRSKLKNYRDQLVKLRQVMVASEYYQCIKHNYVLTQIKTSDPAILTAQVQLADDKQYQEIGLKISTLEHSITANQLAEIDLAKKIAGKKAEIKALSAKSAEQAPVQKHVQHL